MGFKGILTLKSQGNLKDFFFMTSLDVLQLEKWFFDPSPVHFLIFVHELCTWIKNIVVKPRS